MSDESQPYLPRGMLARAAANALNAQASTGPKSPGGKAKSARNALRHGLTSKLVVTPDETARDFDAFAGELVESLEPVGALEAHLVERVILSAWRARRIARLEAGLFVCERENGSQFPSPYEGHSARAVEAMALRGSRVDHLATLTRYEAALERSLFKALHELERAQAKRRGESVPVPATLDVSVSADADACAP